MDLQHIRQRADVIVHAKDDASIKVVGRLMREARRGHLHIVGRPDISMDEVVQRGGKRWPCRF